VEGQNIANEAIRLAGPRSENETEISITQRDVLIKVDVINVSLV
jgi:hypothetical protein